MATGSMATPTALADERGAQQDEQRQPSAPSRAMVKGGSEAAARASVPSGIAMPATVFGNGTRQGVGPIRVDWESRQRSRSMTRCLRTSCTPEQGVELVGEHLLQRG